MSGDKVCFRRLAKVLSPQITLQKRIGVQIAYSQSDTFAEGVQIKQILLSPKICGFAICGTLFANRPPLLSANLFSLMREFF
jgi:hypothetical protein